MLILSRKKNHQILFPHLGIKVEVLRVAGNTVSLGIEAPKSVQILRGELCSSSNEVETSSGTDRMGTQPSRSVLHQVRNQLHQAQMIVALAQKQLESGQLVDPEVVLEDMLRRLNDLEKKRQAATPMAGIAQVSAPESVGKHALLVEDDVNERALLAAYLRLSGFTVTEASDGVEAMAVLAEQSVDLVVLDIQMPRMNGLETLQAMGRQSSLNRTKVVVVSGEDRECLVSDAEIGGAKVVSQWFAKPLNPVHLVDHLQATAN